MLSVGEGVKPIPYGFEAAGNKQFSRSFVSCRFSSRREQTVTVDFRPIVKRRRHIYWRFGILLRHGEKDLVRFHVDSSQFVLLDVNEQREFRYVWPEPFANRWTRMDIVLSRAAGSAEVSCSLDGVFVGGRCLSVNKKEIYPVLAAWSDDYRDHRLLIRDIWVQQGGVGS